MIKSYALLALAGILWGSSFVAGKDAFAFADPVLIVFFRFFIASLFWLPKLSFKRVSSKNKWQLIGISFLMIPATYLLEFIGLNYTSASSATVIIGFTPLMVVLMGWLVWRDRPSLLNVALALVALAGVVLVLGKPTGATFFGSFLILIATVVVAIWIRWSKQLMVQMGSKEFTALTTVIGTVLLIPVGPFFVSSWTITFSWGGMLAVLYLGIGCSLLANWTWNAGIFKVPENSGGLFLSIEPMVGVFMASYLLKEHISPIMMVGTALVILPIIISSCMPLLRFKMKPN